MSAPDPYAGIPDVVYSGDYANWAEARAHSTGYETGAVLERTRVALHKVLRGEAAYERDSMTFDQLELPGSLIAVLLKEAAAHGGRLSLLDFGGALGSTYFQCRSALESLAGLEWSIVELPALVACGRKEFANGPLKFYASIEECFQDRRPSLLLLSGVMQCLPAPWAFLRDAARFEFDRIIVDRTPLLDTAQDRLTVETVSPRLYAASYPAWFFSRARLPENLPAGWKLAEAFPGFDRQLLDGAEVEFKGLVLERSR